MSGNDNGTPAASASDEAIEVESSFNSDECPVCLQQYLLTVQFPCQHKFCFLCAKGFAMKSGQCALCREPIPADFIKDPTNYVNSNQIENCNGEQPLEYGWFYSGKDGWWQYDIRTTQELEKAYTSKVTEPGDSHSVDLLIAGSMYTIDFRTWKQYQCNGSSRLRDVRRDVITSVSNRKGVAGIPLPSSSSGTASRKDSSSSAGNQASKAGGGKSSSSK